MNEEINGNMTPKLGSYIFIELTMIMNVINLMNIYAIILMMKILVVCLQTFINNDDKFMGYGFG